MRGGRGGGGKGGGLLDLGFRVWGLGGLGGGKKVFVRDSVPSARSSRFPVEEWKRLPQIDFNVTLVLT